MNQAFGAPLHEPQLNPAVLDEDFGDTGLQFITLIFTFYLFYINQNILQKIIKLIIIFIIVFSNSPFFQTEQVQIMKILMKHHLMKLQYANLLFKEKNMFVICHLNVI